MKAKVAKIASHGITCFVNRQLIYNYPESLLAEHGIMSIEHADFEGVERLALVTGGEIASSFEKIDGIKIGTCELIEEVMIGEDRVSSDPHTSLWFRGVSFIEHLLMRPSSSIPA
jgi:T-complex protein 1 subunit beta